MTQTMQRKSGVPVFWLALAALVLTAVAVDTLGLEGAQRGRIVGATAVLLSAIVATALFKHRR